MLIVLPQRIIGFNQLLIILKYNIIYSAWPEVVRPFQQAETRLFMEPTERQMDSSRVTVTYGDSESSYNKPMGNYRKPATTVPKRASHTGLVPSRSSVGGQATQTTMPSRYRPHY